MNSTAKSTAARRRSHAEPTAVSFAQSVVLPSDFTRRVARRLAQPLHEALARRASPEQRAAEVLGLVRESLQHEIDRAAAARQAPGAPPPPAPAAPFADRLPLEDLSAAQVLERGLVQLSQASLYRAVREQRFYCIRPRGRTHGRLFPAWQFVDPVPELLPAVLAQLAAQPPASVHAFWVSALDALNELSPAEVLAGRPFALRAALHASQQRLLALPAAERGARVLRAARQAGEGVDFVG